ncbi:MAG TPA: glycine cleavage system protein GcvH [Kiritimatiellia bacterium]|nr:glycine cleavage system protein GcvH [Kiritimatiellia bacterium]
MNVPENLKYTKTHEWVRVDKETITVGITDFAQHQLSELTFVELPDPGQEVAEKDEVAVVESVKAASDVYAPVDGVITSVNEELATKPDLINNDPYGAGWIFKMKVEKASDLDVLLDAESYEELLPKGPES